MQKPDLTITNTKPRQNTRRKFMIRSSDFLRLDLILQATKEWNGQTTRTKTYRIDKNVTIITDYKKILNEWEKYNEIKDSIKQNSKTILILNRRS